MRVAYAAVVAAGCYVGSFTGLTGKRASFDCLDLAAAETEDELAKSAVIAYSLGNRCAQPVLVDLGSIRAVGQFGESIRPVHAYDPHHELRPVHLAAWDAVEEHLWYVDDREQAPSSVCLDVGRVEGDHGEHWLCFGALASAPPRIRFGDSTPPPSRPEASALGVWPVSAEPSPWVENIPPDAQTSVASVGAYFKREIKDQRELVKALHDYVIARLTYDEETAKRIDAGAWFEVPSQDADAVFARRSAVCAGYARLMSALGDAAGVEIAFISGYARDPSTIGSIDALAPFAHAWNAAKIDGRWNLIDATWDDQSPPVSTFLFTPPALFVFMHLPDDPSWQLLSPPVSAEDFARQALVTSVGAQR